MTSNFPENLIGGVETGRERPTAWVGTFRREATRDQKSKFVSLKKEVNARTVVGRREEDPLCAPGSELQQHSVGETLAVVAIIGRRMDGKVKRFKPAHAASTYKRRTRVQKLD